MTKEEKLKLRKQQKAKKPVFLREEWQKRACVPLPWRRPRGLHSKMRHRFAGHRALVHPSYGSPVEVRGLDPSGYVPVVVHTVNDLNKLDVKVQGAVIGSTLGMAKRMALLTKARELGVKVLNVKDIDKELNDSLDKIKARREEKAARNKVKEAKAKEKEKSEKKKPALEKKLSEEEQKKQDKEEKDKVLRQKE